MRTAKKAIKIFVALIAIFFVVFPLFSFSYDAQAAGAPTSAGGDGCLPVPPGDPDCVDLGVPGKCPKLQGSAGLIPCGRDYDDPATTKWDECAPCDLCKGILSGQLIIEFFVKIATVFAVLSIVLGGFLYIFAAGNQGILEKAKSTIKYVLLGFIVILIAWAVVDSILVMGGYIDPIGGEWYAMDC